MDFYYWEKNEMENIAPPLKLLLSVKRQIEKNQPVRIGVLLYLQTETSDFSVSVAQWYSLFQQGKSTHTVLKLMTSMYRRVLLQVLERGLRGESVYQLLCQLENEITEACHDEISNKLAKLPFILLIPLLLMQFPAILMLLFGPLLQNFFHSFGSG